MLFNSTYQDDRPIHSHDTGFTGGLDDVIDLHTGSRSLVLYGNSSTISRREIHI